MAATKLQANWIGVMMGATAITHVNSVQFRQGGSIEMYSADGDHYPTIAMNLMNKPTATVVSGDIAGLQGFAVGTQGTFTATHKDAKLQTGGDIVYTMVNAIVADVDATGAHAQVGSATMTLQATSVDGVTNPISFTRT
jgi:hypothetical protein